MIERMGQMNKDIKDLIDRRGLMLKDVSRNMDVNASTLRRWLSEELTEDRRVQIMEAINITVPEKPSSAMKECSPLTSRPNVWI